MDTQIEKPKDFSEQIIRIVYEYFNVDYSLRLSKSRRQQIIIPKHISCFFLKKYNSKIGYHEMSQRFGMANHTSVLFAVKKVQFLSKRDSFYVKQIENIENIISETLFQRKSIYGNLHKKCSIVGFVGNKKVLFFGFDEKDVFSSIKKMQQDEVFKSISHHDSEYTVSVVESVSDYENKQPLKEPDSSDC